MNEKRTPISDRIRSTNSLDIDIRRRRIVEAVGSAGLIALAGCVGNDTDDPEEDDNDDPEEDDNDDPQEDDTDDPEEDDNDDPQEDDTDDSEEDDTDVVFDREISDIREEFVEVKEGMAVTVEVTGVEEEGDELHFQVGDGTGFVHSERLRSNGSNSYTFETDGRHQLQFNPGRHEAPMNQDVTVQVTAEIHDD